MKSTLIVEPILNFSVHPATIHITVSYFHPSIIFASKASCVFWQWSPFLVLCTLAATCITFSHFHPSLIFVSKGRAAYLVSGVHFEFAVHTAAIHIIVSHFHPSLIIAGKTGSLFWQWSQFCSVLYTLKLFI